MNPFTDQDEGRRDVNEPDEPPCFVPAGGTGEDQIAQEHSGRKGNEGWARIDGDKGQGPAEIPRVCRGRKQKKARCQCECGLDGGIPSCAEEREEDVKEGDEQACVESGEGEGEESKDRPVEAPVFRVDQETAGDRGRDTEHRKPCEGAHHEDRACKNQGVARPLGFPLLPGQGRQQGDRKEFDEHGEAQNHRLAQGRPSRRRTKGQGGEHECDGDAVEVSGTGELDDGERIPGVEKEPEVGAAFSSDQVGEEKEGQEIEGARGEPRGKRIIMEGGHSHEEDLRRRWVNT